MWAVYAPYAESDFRDGFARDPDARFWEMYLGVQLLCEGRTLLTAAQRGVNGSMPDICVVERGRRIWIEAIVPERGEGADAVPLPSPINRGGRVRAAPIREIDLRTTGAFWTKSQVVGHYLNLGVIGAQDVRLIAIGVGRFGAYASEHPIPQVLSALLPIGEYFATFDTKADRITGQGFQPSFEITRKGTTAIPRTAFVDPQFSHISGVIWSRAGIGGWGRSVRPLTFVHNPLATVRMLRGWCEWDREFVASRLNEQDWEARDIAALPFGLWRRLACTLRRFGRRVPSSGASLG